MVYTDGSSIETNPLVSLEVRVVRGMMVGNIKHCRRVLSVYFFKFFGWWFLEHNASGMGKWEVYLD